MTKIKGLEIETLKSKNFRWVNVKKNGKKEMGYLQKNFDFHPLDLEDCLPPLQRSKLVERHDYVFMILLFPVYNSSTHTLKATEVDFFVSPQTIITVHKNDLLPIKELFELLKNDADAQRRYLEGGPCNFIYEILDRTQNFCFRMLRHINNDIRNIEREIFNGQEKTIVQEILRTKRNIVSFRKSLQPHKNVLQRFAKRSSQNNTSCKVEHKVFFDNLIEQAKDIWDLLENQKETINALHDTNESLISFKLNTIMKTLTIISVVLLPINMIASLFGMNTVSTPLVKMTFGFWIIVLIMFGLTGGLLSVFKGKKWL